MVMSLLKRALQELVGADESENPYASFGGGLPAPSPTTAMTIHGTANQQPDRARRTISLSQALDIQTQDATAQSKVQHIDAATQTNVNVIPETECQMLMSQALQRMEEQHQQTRSLAERYDGVVLRLQTEIQQLKGSMQGGSATVVATVSDATYNKEPPRCNEERATFSSPLSPNCNSSDLDMNNLDPGRPEDGRLDEHEQWTSHENDDDKRRRERRERKLVARHQRERALRERFAASTS